VPGIRFACIIFPCGTKARVVATAAKLLPERSRMRIALSFPQPLRIKLFPFDEFGTASPGKSLATGGKPKKWTRIAI
jgi:hypothetical protein